MTSPRGSAPAVRSAFTLVELLVVISIIGILAALIIGAASSAIVRAGNLHCQNNLRQIALAVRTYCGQNEGVIPPVKLARSGLYWCNLLVAGKYIPDASTDTLPDGEKTKQDSLFLCPQSTDDVVIENDEITAPDSPKAQGWYRVGVKTGNKPITTDCSYYWNGYTGTTAEKIARYPSLVINEAAADRMKYIHELGEIKKASLLIMLADGVFFDGDSKPARIAARHRGEQGPLSLTNVVYYDGHTESIERTRDPQGDTWMTDPIMKRSPNLEGGPPFFMLPKR